MVTIHIADHEESYAGDKTKDATRRTVDEFRETRLIESFVPTHKKSPFSIDFTLRYKCLNQGLPPISFLVYEAQSFAVTVTASCSIGAAG
jgi:hypothetical protein